MSLFIRSPQTIASQVVTFDMVAHHKVSIRDVMLQSQVFKDEGEQVVADAPLGVYPCT